MLVDEEVGELGWCSEKGKGGGVVEVLGRWTELVCMETGVLGR